MIANNALKIQQKLFHNVHVPQNVTGTYIIIMLVYRRLLTMWQSGCVIANNTQGYNLEVCGVGTDVTNYITCKSGFV